METIGRYELRGKLGKGGFGTVYRVWDTALDREVALKSLLPHLSEDPEVRQRFLAEARALARLRHPNIVTIYDVGEAGGQPFFTMELIDGPTLAEVLAANEVLQPPLATDVMRNLCSAVDFLHQAGLVHRDIKAANVMRDAFGRIVLMDFSVARTLDQAQYTGTGAIVGTLEYIAPEQVRGQPVGPAADIYALGVLGYHMFAGRPPFRGDAAYVLYGHAHEPPPPLRERRPGLPEAIYATIDAALQKDPAQRPATAGEFAARLTGGPIPANRPAAVAARRRRAGMETAAPADLPGGGIPFFREPVATGVVSQSHNGGAEPTYPSMPPRPAAPLGATPVPVSRPAAASAVRPAPAPVASFGGPPSPPRGGSGNGYGPGPAPIPGPRAANPIATNGGTTAGRLLLAMLALAVIALIAFALVRGDGNSGSSAITTRAGSGASLGGAPALPVVSELKVFDSVFTLREEEFEVGTGVAACFGLKQGDDSDPLAIVVAPERGTPLDDPQDPSVVARSATIAQRTSATCYAVPLTKPPLPAGRYTMTVFHNTDRLASRSFTARLAPGGNLVTDVFDTPAAGALPLQSADATHYRRGYDNGEYVIQITNPGPNVEANASVRGTYADLAVGVDARLVGDTAGRYLVMQCRRGASVADGYEFWMAPNDGSFGLKRYDNGRDVALVGAQQSPAIRRGNASNRLEMSCAGSTITISANGTQLASVFDATYKTGQLFLKVGAVRDDQPAEARFDNLTVTQR